MITTNIQSNATLHQTILHGTEVLKQQPEIPGVCVTNDGGPQNVYIFRDKDSYTKLQAEIANKVLPENQFPHPYTEQVALQRHAIYSQQSATLFNAMTIDLWDTYKSLNKKSVDFELGNIFVILTEH
jgi:hypothetical protein